MTDKILIIDDDIEILKSVKRIFSDQFQVFTTTTTSQALEILHNHNIKVILIDQHLGGDIKGIEFAERIENQFPTKVRILITSSVSTDVVISAINSSVIDSFVSKPISSEELLKFVKEGIDKYDDRVKKIAESVEKLKHGEPLSMQQISSLGDKIEILGSLLDASINSPGSSRDGNMCNLLGLSIFAHNEILYQTFLTDQFELKDKSIFMGFVESLSNLSNDLFSNQDLEIELIQLDVSSGLLKQYGEYNLILFLGTGATQLCINIIEDGKNLVNMISRDLPTSPSDFNESSIKSIDTKLDKFKNSITCSEHSYHV